MLDKLSVWLGAGPPQNVVFHQRELLLQLLAGRRGAVLLGSHLGNLEICRALADSRSDLRLNILVHTRHADRFNRVLRRLSAHRQFELIEVTELDPGIAVALAERVQRGEFLVIFADRTAVGPSSRRVWVPFLGRPAPFPQGPFILAALLKCPVYLMFGLRRGEQHHVYIEHFADQLALPRKQRLEHVREAAARYAARLEHYCRQAPLQWCNFYPFWDDTQPAAANGKSSAHGGLGDTL
jgi:predicted LPLAT superfamily acyltransferase